MSVDEAIHSIAVRYRQDQLELFEFWLERASIIEYQGGITREDADTQALEQTELWAKERSRK